ncbi:MAG: DHH family phosphoesterase [archaeon]
MKKFPLFLHSLKGKKILIMPHAGADVDAIASAGALFLALKKKIQAKHSRSRTHFIECKVPSRKIKYSF